MQKLQAYVVTSVYAASETAFCRSIFLPENFTYRYHAAIYAACGYSLLNAGESAAAALLESHVYFPWEA